MVERVGDIFGSAMTARHDHGAESAVDGNAPGAQVRASGRLPATASLFADGDPPPQSAVVLAESAVVLRGAASPEAPRILAEIERITARAPFRNMTTPGGFRMSVAMTNCGEYGWVSDRTGYRYSPVDPLSGNKWPPIPDVLLDCAARAAAAAGFARFAPDACLVNRYAPGTKLSLHQDKDEADKAWPVVSISLGLPATFVWGGTRRDDPTVRVPLVHGDVVVWGGASRLNYHGVLTVKAGAHPLVGAQRISLTLRRAR
jgi:alkylated DNA repair protein (DNA oxidative demethylase)